MYIHSLSVNCLSCVYKILKTSSSVQNQSHMGLSANEKRGERRLFGLTRTSVVCTVVTLRLACVCKVAARTWSCPVRVIFQSRQRSTNPVLPSRRRLLRRQRLITQNYRRLRCRTAAVEFRSAHFATVNVLYTPIRLSLNIFEYSVFASASETALLSPMILSDFFIFHFSNKICARFSSLETNVID